MRRDCKACEEAQRTIEVYVEDCRAAHRELEIKGLEIARLKTRIRELERLIQAEAEMGCHLFEIGQECH